MTTTEMPPKVKALTGKPVGSVNIIVEKGEIRALRDTLLSLEPLKELLLKIPSNVDRHLPFESLVGGRHTPDGYQRIRKTLEDNNMLSVEPHNFHGFQLQYLAEDHHLVVKVLRSVGIEVS